MFVFSSLVALCYIEFTVLTVVFFFVFLTWPVLEAGIYLSVLTTPPLPGHYKRPAFNGIQATIRGFTVVVSYTYTQVGVAWEFLTP